MAEKSRSFREKLKPLRPTLLATLGLLVQSCGSSQLPRLYETQYCTSSELHSPLVAASKDPNIIVLPSSPEFEFNDRRIVFCHMTSLGSPLTYVFDLNEFGLPKLLKKFDSHLSKKEAANFVSGLEPNDSPLHILPKNFELFPENRPTAALAKDVLIQDQEILFSLADVDFNSTEFLQSKFPQSAHYGPLLFEYSNKFSISQKLLIAVLEENNHLSNPSLDLESMKVLLQSIISDILLSYYQYVENPQARSTFFADGQAVYTASDTDTAASFAIRSHIARYNSDPSVVESTLAKIKSNYRDFGFTNPVFPPLLVEKSDFALPFAGTWNLTGGAHASYGNMHAATFGAVDFAPTEDLRCGVDSKSSILAIADGPIVYSEGGHVIQDISHDGIISDGLPQTGWRVLYLHTRSSDAAPVGVVLSKGDRIGAPSCEGGFANGNHVHLAIARDGRYLNARYLSFEGKSLEHDKSEYKGGMIIDDNILIPASNYGNDKLERFSPIKSKNTATGR